MSTDPLQLNSQYVGYVAHVALPFTIVTFFLYGARTSLLLGSLSLMNINKKASIRIYSSPISNFKISIPSLFILVTLAVILSTISSYEELRSQTQLESALGNLQSLAQPDSHYYDYYKSNVGAVSVLGVLSTLADFILLYRAYMLWDYRVAIIVVPIIILLCSVATYLCGLIYLQKASVALLTDPYVAERDHRIVMMWSLACVSSTMVNSLALTTLIIYRVRKLTQVTNKFLPCSERVSSGRLVKAVIGSYLLYGIGISIVIGFVVGLGVDPSKTSPILALIMNSSLSTTIGHLSDILDRRGGLERSSYQESAEQFT
ncbi:hypothetical protein D9757_010012 [Collybiopsis confluens]|uniref:Uncharacterized protein n=1 Tax=Collybiopsis confluens TaxID=2823264 RepID=A0A8H5GUG6_9AGAR|nr:hypothetical protein D9757_010012 [Collybiopsis confluens]